MNKYSHISPAKEKSQINIRVSSEIYRLWNKIIQLEDDPKVTKGMLFGDLITFYRDNPPDEPLLSDDEQRRIELHQQIGQAALLLTTLKSELKSIEYDLWKAAGTSKLINIAVSDDVYVEWSHFNTAMKESAPATQQADIMTQLIRNYANTPSINDLVQADKLDAKEGISKSEAKLRAKLRVKLAKDAKLKSPDK